VTAPVTPTRTRHSSPGTRGHATPTGRKLTVEEICSELGISRKTFYEWRAKGKAPRCIKLPNGEIRVRVADYESWLTTLEEVA
jgi:excisionase family DNA binding protein